MSSCTFGDTSKSKAMSSSSITEEARSYYNHDHQEAYATLARFSKICKIRENFNQLMVKEPRKEGKSLTHQMFRRTVDTSVPPGYVKMIRDLFNKKGGMDVDYQFPLRERRISGYTALHFASLARNYVAVHLLLELGADPTIQAQCGFTSLRSAAGSRYRDEEQRDCFEMMGRLEHPLLDLLLDAQVKMNNPTNSSCPSGISHLHIACMANHTGAVEMFLENGVDVNERVESDSNNLILPARGYTPLHFAARYCSVETIRVLLQHGADRNLKDAEGMTPLYLLIECLAAATTAAQSNKLNQAALLLLTGNVNKRPSADSSDANGLSYLHLLCTDATIKDNYFPRDVGDLDAAISSDSAFRPGYTPLHFAAHFNLDTFYALVERGANIAAKDAKGVTPIDLVCARKYGGKCLRSILEQAQPAVDVRFSNGDRLGDVVASDDAFLRYLNNAGNKSVRISPDSPIWPGCNLLHVAVNLAEVEEAVDDTTSGDDSDEDDSPYKCDKKVVACLLRGVKLSTQDSTHGTSPLHLAFRQRKRAIVRKMVSRLTSTSANPADSDGLSHLHIMVCEQREVKFNRESAAFVSAAHANRRIKIQLEYDNRRFAAGSTALHMAVIVGSAALVEMLLRHGADLNMKNSEGLSPVHLAALLSRSDCVDKLTSHPMFLSENTIAKGGFSNLHAACCTSSSQAIENFIKLGADVNLAITSDYREHDPDILPLNLGYTPLHLAVGHLSLDMVELLVKHGANITAKDKSGITPEHLSIKINADRGELCTSDARDILRYFFRLRQAQDPDYVDPETGITLLHMACAGVDKEAVTQLIGSRGANVNAQISSGSPIYPGCTPLHLLTNACEAKKDERKIAIIEILLQNGADVTVADVNYKTPVHFNYDCMTPVHDTLLEHQRSYKINPANGEGVSHFHFASINNKPKIVEAFLQNGIDPNLATDYFKEEQAGYTALHYAMSSSQDTSSTIDALVKYGADVNARDAAGWTPLHVAFGKNLQEDNVKALLRSGKIDVNALNYVGERPLEVLFTENKSAEQISKALSLYLAHGGLMNVYNPVTSVGLLGSLVKTDDKSLDLFKVVLKEAKDADTIDPTSGRNALHNVVSIGSKLVEDDKYERAIGDLLKRGVELDLQDKRGRTPLYLAAQYNNATAVDRLLLLGADVNVADADGKAAFEFLKDFNEANHNIVSRLFDSHVRKLIHLGLEVSAKNRWLYESLRWYGKSSSWLFDSHTEELQHMYVIDKTLSLRDFLKEETLAYYPVMATWKRQAIDDFARDKKDLCSENTFGYLVNLHIRRAKKRLSMMEPAMRALGYIASVDVPVPCAENILKYLTNSEFENLIKLLPPPTPATK